MERAVKVEIWCGGSDTPFTFHTTKKESDGIVTDFMAGRSFEINTITKNRAVFNGKRVDAVKISED